MKWNKIYRGGVHRTTPETREVDAPATGTFLPGTAVTITTAAGGMTVQKGISGIRDFFYVIGEQMLGTVDENQVGLKSSMRLYQPHSGDLLAGRAAAGLTLLDDTPLTINADGRFAGAATGDKVYAYVDNPSSAHPTAPAPTVLDQLIPIKIS